jgi:phage terminase large subunit-like protein
VMVDGPSGLRSLPGRERPRWEQSRRRLLWANGALGYAFSAEDPESLRGPQFDAAWADEFCVWKKPEETLANLRLGLRRGADPRLVVTTTPRPTRPFRLLRAEPTTVTTHAPTSANADNLSPAFVEGLLALYGGTRRAAQELEGLMVESEGALFRAEELARAFGPAPERLERVVVAVDPPAGVDGSACGIVVAGRAAGRFYVLADRSQAGLSPLGWARLAVEAAQAFGAAEIVAEANQGGHMVRATLVGAGAAATVRLVHASEGKRARAEPVATLYERGAVTHAERFPALEEELMALGASETARFDRADALVWALTALMDGVFAAAPRVRGL